MEETRADAGANPEPTSDPVPAPSSQQPKGERTGSYVGVIACVLVAIALLALAWKLWPRVRA